MIEVVILMGDGLALWGILDIEDGLEDRFFALLDPLTDGMEVGSEL